MNYNMSPALQELLKNGLDEGEYCEAARLCARSACAQGCDLKDWLDLCEQHWIEASEETDEDEDE